MLDKNGNTLLKPSPLKKKPGGGHWQQQQQQWGAENEGMEGAVAADAGVPMHGPESHAGMQRGGIGGSLGQRMVEEVKNEKRRLRAGGKDALMEKLKSGGIFGMLRGGFPFKEQSAFKMRSGNTTPFKLMGSSPAKHDVTPHTEHHSMTGTVNTKGTKVINEDGEWAGVGDRPDLVEKDSTKVKKERTVNVTKIKKEKSSGLKQAIGGGAGEALAHHKKYLAKKAFDKWFKKNILDVPGGKVKSVISEQPRGRVYTKKLPSQPKAKTLTKQVFKQGAKKGLGKTILRGAAKVASKLALPLTIADIGYELVKGKTNKPPKKIKSNINKGFNF